MRTTTTEERGKIIAKLFVLQSLTGESIGRIAWASRPFFWLMGLAAVIVSVWHELVPWLPRVMANWYRW